MSRKFIITGMSGTGKSTVINAMRKRGYIGIDMDDDDWSIPNEVGDTVWNETKLQHLLDSLADDDILFVSGCADNQGKFYPQFDKVILLSAPKETIIHRLQTRTTNTYGKHPDELAETLGYIEAVEPLLRRRANLEINTTQSVDDVIETIVKLIN